MIRSRVWRVGSLVQCPADSKKRKEGNPAIAQATVVAGVSHTPPHSRHLIPAGCTKAHSRTERAKAPVFTIGILNFLYYL